MASSSSDEYARLVKVGMEGFAFVEERMGQTLRRSIVHHYHQYHSVIHQPAGGPVIDNYEAARKYGGVIILNCASRNACSTTSI